MITAFTVCQFIRTFMFVKRRTVKSFIATATLHALFVPHFSIPSRDRGLLGGENRPFAR